MNPPLALTSGEPAGVGPELCIRLAQTELTRDVVVLADAELLIDRAMGLKLPLNLVGHDVGHVDPPGLRVQHIPLVSPSREGELDPANASQVLALLDRAVEGCTAGNFAGMVTAPVHKGVINDAGIPFTGHTEYLAQRTGTARVVMMLVSDRLRVALATTHLPLSRVPEAITRQGLNETLDILHHDLIHRFGIPCPVILVCGLNPHAGENGHLGDEEINIIAPAIADAQARGIDARGPYPADSLFTPGRHAGSHCVLAMYHDQGLAPLKQASFGEAVNVTLGLPIVRTSVDHGVALDLAGSGQVRPDSLFHAVRLARQLASHTETP